MLKQEIQIARELLSAMREQNLDEKLQITALDLIRKLEEGSIHRQEAQMEVEKFWMGALRRAVVEGDVETGSLMAGQSVGLMDRIVPVRELIDELLADASAELDQVKAKLS